MRQHEIRAEYDARTIVVYQAYSPAIALPAVKAQKFVAPFSLNRMTWIKPSFLWMMERSNWGQKSGQEHILAIRITRQGWEEALGQAVLTTFTQRVYPNRESWEAQFAQAPVYVQWDPERTIHGKSLLERSIQVGLSRRLIQRYVDTWIVSITDITPKVRKMSQLLRSGHEDQARAMLPRERIYPVEPALMRRLGMEA